MEAGYHADRGAPGRTDDALLVIRLESSLGDMEVVGTGTGLVNETIPALSVVNERDCWLRPLVN